MSAKDRKSGDTKVTIKIPRHLYNRISEIVEGSGFNSVTEFVVYVLRDLVSTDVEREVTGKPGDKGLSREEIQAIRKRLKSLGYL